jgi:hypothetical protein
MRRALVTLAVLLAAPSAASAATVHVAAAHRLDYPNVSYLYSPESYSFVYYDAAPGEQNRLTIDYKADESAVVTVTLSDPGAVIEPGEDCTSLGPHQARCRNTVGVGHHIEATQAKLGDGDDEVHSHVQALASEGGTILYGGTGDDVLAGTRQLDLLDGGGGHDRLYGGDGGDLLTDGDVSGDTGARRPDADLLDGGPYEDMVSYRGRTGDVAVDLGSGTGGEKGEGDVIQGVEQALGGAGDDRLLGTNDPNELFGGHGSDLLVGRGRRDDIHGGPGRDDVRGGGGPDFVYPGSGRDRVSCGTGDDDVSGPQKGENLRGPCEHAYWSFSTAGGDFPEIGFPPNPAAVRRRSVDFLLDCPQFDDDGESLETGCSGDLVVRAGRHRVGSTDFELSRDSSPFVRVHLNRLGRRLVRRKRGFLATMTLDFDNVPKVAWTVRVRR